MNDSQLESSSGREFFSTDHLMSGLKKRAMRGASAIVFAQVSIYGIQTIGTIILARLLTPDDFGLVAMVLAFSLLLQNFGVNGFTEAVIQTEQIHHKQISTLFWINVSFSLLLTIFLIALAPILAWFYKEPRLELITVVIAFSIVFAGCSTHHLALLKRNMQFYRTSANDVGAALISVILAIVLACWGWGYWALVTRWITLPLATAIGAWLLCQWRPGLPARATGVRPMLRFAFNTYGNFITDYFCRNIDKVLIGRFHGAQSLGHYSRAYHLSNMLASQLVHPLTSVAIAALSRLSNDPEKLRRSYLTALSILAFVCMPMSAVLTLVGRDLVLLFLGPQWHKAGQIFSAFGPSIGIAIIYFTHGWLHLSLGRADRWFRWGIVALIVTAIAFVIGLPFGPLGVAIAYAASFYVLIGPGLWYAGRPIHLKLSSIVSVIWKYYISALTAGLLCWFLLYSYDFTSSIFIELSILMRILVPCVLCIAIYLPLIVALFQSRRPISQFVSVIHDMIPSISFGKSIC